MSPVDEGPPPFSATHEIVITTTDTVMRIPVRWNDIDPDHDEGGAELPTRAEWDNDDLAVWEIDEDGTITFEGDEPICDHVELVPIH